MMITWKKTTVDDSWPRKLGESKLSKAAKNVEALKGLDRKGTEKLLGTGELGNSSAAQRNRLLADLVAAETAREGAVTGKTQEDQARAWDRWVEWCRSTGISNDVFLDEFSRSERNKLFGAFAMALREGRFSGSNVHSLAESTVRNSLSFVASTFREHDRPNPTRDEDGELSRLLSRQFRAFKNDDPNPIQQKALPIGVLSEIAKRQTTETERAISQLAIGAFFFACRSCEYLKVPSAEKRRTDVLRLRNIRFLLNGRELDHGNSRLEFADCVAITFEWQKKDERMDTVTQMASGDALLCPVRQWAALMKRIRNYKGATDNTPVSAVWKNGRMEDVTSKMMVDALEAGVAAVGYEKLGIKKDEIGTHSIRSGAAMAMYLGECPVYTIMMIGRWSSDAFLRYIRKQVEQFSHNVSRRMLRYQYHRHIQEREPRVSHLDPRQHNHPNNAETRRNVAGDMTRRVRLPAFSLFN
mmetsp:Transcript_30867/g.65030  ORF Transcript_30867/g.65030 Transcript_30867/m.65030 type:complete len:470 (+) Transcript_30867:3029-4438(+)